MRLTVALCSVVKQAAEYRIAASGQKLAALVVVISDIPALGSNFPLRVSPRLRADPRRY